MRIHRYHGVSAAVLSLVLIAVVTSVGAPLRRVLEEFDYPDTAAARAAWSPAEDAPPVEVAPATDTADRRDPASRWMRMPAPFTGPPRRAVCDRDVDLDLSRYGRFHLTVRTGTPDAFASFTLYFRSGDGWYGGNARIPSAGTHVLTFRRSDFLPEGDPAGWNRIDGIRLSAWKQDQVDTWIDVNHLVAEGSEYVVVRPTEAIRRGNEEAASADRYADAMIRLLREAGLGPDSLNDEDVVAGGLEGRRFAILPYQPVVPDAEAAALERFVAGGGRIGVCYIAEPPLANLLGLEEIHWRSRERDGEFESIDFAGAEIPGLPTEVRQGSWNATLARPGGNGCRVVGRWRDADGVTSDLGAVFVSDSGFFYGHVVTAVDGEAKGRMLTALIGGFFPDMWETVVDRLVAMDGPVGHLADGAAAMSFIEEATGDRDDASAVAARSLRDKAGDRLDRARALRDRGDPAAAVSASAAMRDLLAEAYVRAHESRPREARAVWNHSGTGPNPGDWDASMETLSRGGINMVIPNMWWAGVAHYASDLLPRSSTFDRYGDQVAQCVEAGRRHGVEVHPWKVNWNLLNAPSEFVERMRAEKRTQVSDTGEPLNWLCPSHPANFELELATMLEVVRNYDVDGVHFDYIRYPDRHGCYCDGCRARFEESRGAPVENWPADAYDGPLADEYTDWRCAQITRLVRETSRRAREIKPGIRISAAVFGYYPGCRYSIGQDWVLWAKEGYLDFVCPMDYELDDDRFARLVRGQVDLVDDAVPIYAGIGASSSRAHLAPDRVVGQIYLSRREGADGFVIFNFGTMSPDVLAACGTSILATPATPPHADAGPAGVPSPTP